MYIQRWNIGLRCDGGRCHDLVDKPAELPGGQCDQREPGDKDEVLAEAISAPVTGGGRRRRRAPVADSNLSGRGRQWPRGL